MFPSSKCNVCMLYLFSVETKIIAKENKFSIKFIEVFIRLMTSFVRCTARFSLFEINRYKVSTIVFSINEKSGDSGTEA